MSRLRFCGKFLTAIVLIVGRLRCGSVWYFRHFKIGWRTENGGKTESRFGKQSWQKAGCRDGFSRFPKATGIGRGDTERRSDDPRDTGVSNENGLYLSSSGVVETDSFCDMLLQKGARGLRLEKMQERYQELMVSDRSELGWDGESSMRR